MSNDNFSNHPLQSEQWKEFREKSGIKIIRQNGIQVSFHKIPKTNFTVSSNVPFPFLPHPQRKGIMCSLFNPVIP